MLLHFFRRIFHERQLRWNDRRNAASGFRYGPDETPRDLVFRVLHVCEIKYSIARAVDDDDGVASPCLPKNRSWLAFVKSSQARRCDKMFTTNLLAVLRQVKCEHAAFPLRCSWIALSGRPDTFEVGRFARCSLRGTRSTGAQAAACDGQCREQADGSGNAGNHVHRQAGDWWQPSILLRARQDAVRSMSRAERADRDACPNWRCLPVSSRHYQQR